MKIALFGGPGRQAACRPWCAPVVALALLAGALGVPPLRAAPLAEADARPALAVAAFQHSVIQAVHNTGKRLVAVGERGLILLSDDDGASWRQARVPVSVGLTAVRFPTPSQGWAVGHFGTVLHSADGGESWQVQLRGGQAAELMLADARLRARDDVEQSAAVASAQRMVDDGPDKPLLDLYFADEQHGIVVGAYNLILATRDGGQTWQSLSARLDNPGARHLYAIAGGGSSLYIAGEEGRVFRSDDLGASFTRLATPYQGSYFTVAADAASVVVAGLRGNAFRSSDRGQTWSQLQSPAPVSVVASLLGRDGRLILANQAGQLLESRDQDARLQPLAAAPLPPPTGLALQASGELLVSSLQGLVRPAVRPAQH
ncbi:WD40/YVTN/BNR-like repeat-containing protein [Pseudomonas sp. GCM10022188]|uniref:WD40/YVTN/BNR-like repeat-containing protein n=1 Tax=Pseudomonas TaxID=286 RepID=UPI001E3C126E|nr:YCF48-related protein [Pseudomonas oryzagri]MCC6075105.1 YCF48-related protein [Pseudomonas oryzagri]